MTERKPFKFKGGIADHAWNALAAHLFHQRHREVERVTAAVKSAPVPMPPDIVTALVQLGPNDIHDALRAAHPGFALWEKKKSYQISFEVFESSFKDLLAAIGRFEVACEDALLSSHSRDHEVGQYERAMQKELFAAANAAHSLVDHSTRQLQKEANIPEYEDRLSAAFGADGLHETIIGLRNILHHFHMLKAGWQWTKTFGEGGKTEYSFNLDRDSLLLAATERRDKLSGFARIQEFLSKSSDKIEVRKLFEEYQKRASTFHAWLSDELKRESFVALRDVERCFKENRNFAKRNWWHAMLGNWLNWKVPPNPYDHLPKYLNEEQLLEVYQLPLGSPEQVDKVIEFVDVDGACDEPLRKRAYEFFRRGADAKGLPSNKRPAD